MLIAVFLIRNDNTGYIELYEIDSLSFQEFEKRINQIYPSSNGDWNSILEELKRLGKRVQTIIPDYSFSVNLDEL